MKCLNCGKEFIPEKRELIDGRYVTHGAYCCCIECTIEYCDKHELWEKKKQSKHNQNWTRMQYTDEMIERWEHCIEEINRFMEKYKISRKECRKLLQCRCTSSTFGLYMRGKQLPNPKTERYKQIIKFADEYEEYEKSGAGRLKHIIARYMDRQEPGRI